jgi:hypothetical protein
MKRAIPSIRDTQENPENSGLASSIWQLKNKLQTDENDPY